MSADSSPGSSAETNAGGAVADDVPESVAAMVGKPMYEETATFPVERSYGYNTLAATQNANPLFWDEAVAEDLTGGITLPPTTLSLWMRPHYWEPGAVGEQVALKVHFDLKSIFGLPEAVMTDNTIIFHSPVRPGDVISNRQVLKSVSGPKTTKLGAGRFWVIDVEFHNQNGELVGVESYTGFGYNRPGAADSAADGAPGGRADSAAGGAPASEGASA